MVFAQMRAFSTARILASKDRSSPKRPEEEQAKKGSRLTHVTPTGTAHMVSINAKAHTHRKAIACGTVQFSTPEPHVLISANAMKKGDVLSVARIAGIMAAKRTADLVPLCHPISLTSVGVDVELVGPEDVDKAGGVGAFGGVRLRAKVECQGATGVEMEALTAVSVAALTAPAASAGGKKQKKKWSKGKVKDKANHAVILDKSTADRLNKDVQSYRLITVATLVDRLKINGSLARSALKDLEEKGTIKQVVGHSKMKIYTRAVGATE
ncbi:MAG: hypothetical protein M1819_006240 [Sarea resinae]|nr:MAG: hypothetical protein M1819_006240 [Sarea resinae]